MKEMNEKKCSLEKKDLSNVKGGTFFPCANFATCTLWVSIKACTYGGGWPVPPCYVLPTE